YAYLDSLTDAATHTHRSANRSCWPKECSFNSFIERSINMNSHTKDRLIETARRLFWQHGYTGTGIAQILKDADAGSGSLYYFFPTKEDLLLAVLDHYKTILEPCVLRPVFERVSDPIERIFGLLDGYRQQLIVTEF